MRLEAVRTVNEGTERRTRGDRPPQPGTRLLKIVDAALPPAACRSLIRAARAASDEGWMTSTAEIPRAANTPPVSVPRRDPASADPCRLVGADARPDFAAIDDPLLALRLFYRVRGALPETLGEAQLAGIKPLMRCFRFGPGEGTAAHRDPARLCRDGQRSRLSVLVFLNDNFTGPGLEFPDLERTITARAGRAVVFSHDLIHGDGVVERGNKYLLQADVFYSECWKPYRQR